jgi:hypothetical protein
MPHTVVAQRPIQGPASRVVAEIDGGPVWFEANLPLVLSSEAIVSAFLLICGHHGRALALDATLTTRFRDNLTPLQRVIREFWGYPEVVLSEPLGDRQQMKGQLVPAYRGAALMFSGGVDSFYSLLRGPLAPDALVLVEGFDIPLSQPNRTDVAWASLQAVANHFGLEAVKVATNLREHELFRSVDWEVTHGGALAAVGHLLASQYSHVIISSSNPYLQPSKPWGSHFRLDTHWSSERMSLLHVGATHVRGDKLLEIADEPIVQEHLRVCWEGETTQLNCGRCEKCVRTQLVLLSAGKRERFATFVVTDAQLMEAVRVLPYVPSKNSVENVYAGFATANRATALGREVARLVGRSYRHYRKQTLKKSVAGRIVSKIFY